MDTLKSKGPWWEFKPYLATLEPFRTHGSLSAESGKPGDFTYAFLGRLAEPFRSEFQSRWDQVDYVVYSYGTPIAWHYADTDSWVTPQAKYSVTTFAQQSKIFTAISQL